MTKDTIVQACESEGLKATADGFAIPEERDATFLVAAPGEVLMVGKVVRAELREKSLCLQTAKGERFVLTYDLVLGLRLLAGKPAKDHLGFSR